VYPCTQKKINKFKKLKINTRTVSTLQKRAKMQKSDKKKLKANEKKNI
jgi:hypothetical protein